MPRKIQRYGWKPSLPDHRDFRLASLPRPRPSHFSLRPECPAVVDQGSLGSCTANAICSLDEFVQMKEKVPAFQGSRLFLYFCERALEGTIDHDAGAAIRDGMKVLNAQGVPKETTWPYDISKFTANPSQAAYDEARLHKSITYYSIGQDLGSLTSCLLSGYPFVFGFTIYDSFETDEVTRTGIVPMPSSGEGVIGGHAVMCVGYNDATQRMIVRNSWGASWGQGGYFEMPYAYISSPQLAADFWTLRRTT